MDVVQDCVHANSIWTQEAAQGRHAYRLDFDNLFSQAPESQVKSCDWNWSLGQNFLRRPQSSSTLPRYVSSFSSKAWHNHSIGDLSMAQAMAAHGRRLFSLNVCSLTGLRWVVVFDEFFLHVTTCASK